MCVTHLLGLAAGGWRIAHAALVVYREFGGNAWVIGLYRVAIAMAEVFSGREMARVTGRLHAICMHT